MMDRMRPVDAEETVGFGQKRTQHEQAAHQKRNWVRLTYACNDRCVFCLDADTHDGEIRDRDQVKAQILDGRRSGAERLILSGGEPTIHPDFVDFIRLGKAAGYARVQTVTNGRMFAYADFLRRALDAGLGEITFSIHGPDARIHDALVGVPGAWAEEISGLKAALADGRPIVNVDICVNRANVKHLAEMLETYIAMGVKEFDLLQVIPFGRAYRDGKDTLFYDLEQARPHLVAAFEYARKPGIHIWLNRFPVEHLEGFEELIQDPYKLGDEVRGRKEEFARLLDHGMPLSCREPERCKYCYVERLCDHLDETRAAVAIGVFELVRIDTRWEALQPPVYGGDPASARRARHLPIVGETAVGVDLPARIANSGARTAWVVAPDVAAAEQALTRVRGLEQVELELDEIEGLVARDPLAPLADRLLTTVRARNLAQTQALVSWAQGVEVVAPLSREVAAWLLSEATWPRTLALSLPNHELASTAATEDPDVPAVLHALGQRFGGDFPVENVPHCMLGRAPRRPRPVLDTTLFTDGGGVEIFRYTRRFMQSHYRVKSLRCRACVFDGECSGVHVNYVRAHGFGALQPVR